MVGSAVSTGGVVDFIWYLLIIGKSCIVYELHTDTHFYREFIADGASLINFTVNLGVRFS